MFASIMESVLVKHLGKYVDGIKHNLDVSIINGDVTLENISIKPQIINELKLPFLLKFSHLNKMVVKVPWTNLKDKPTIVSIQGIYALFAFNYDSLDEDYFDPRERVIEIANRIKQEFKKKLEDRVGKEESFAEKSLIRIIDNVVVSVEDIHVRFESIKRGWDFSIGLTISSINCHTVDDFGHKIHYVRHFTHKEENKVFRKVFNFNQIKIYFNEEEAVFLSWEVGKGKDHMIRLMNQPFKTKQKSLSSLDYARTYSLQHMTEFSFEIIGEQHFSKEKRYAIEIRPQFSKLAFSITDRQFSQFLSILEFVYEWWLNLQKNGNKLYSYSDKVEEYFKATILKLSKDEKMTETEMKNLETIAMEVPLVILERSVDDLTKAYRIEKEMKKLNKMSNKDKSKKLMQRMMEKLEFEDLDIMELFEHILITFLMPEIRISCERNHQRIFEWGFIGIIGEMKIILAKSLFFDLKISEIFMTDFIDNEPRNIIERTKYVEQPFVNISFSQSHKMPPITKITMRKRKIELYEQTLIQLIRWNSLVKLRPPLINFLREQLEYSIHITEEMFKAMFDHEELSITVCAEVPVLCFENELEVDLGTYTIHRQAKNLYKAVIDSKQYVKVKGEEVVSFKEGNSASFINEKPLGVEVDLKHLEVKNLYLLIDFVDKMLGSQLMRAMSEMDFKFEEKIEFEGEFILNEYLEPQKMMLWANRLYFMPSGDNVSLLRTRLYPFRKEEKFGLLFREEVHKAINIVLMKDDKTMNTLYMRLREHMFFICTFSQWKKYYQGLTYSEPLTQIDALEVFEENQELVRLEVSCDSFKASLETIDLEISSLSTAILYKEYNTDAVASMGSLTMSQLKQKIIEELSLELSYRYLYHVDVDLLMNKFHFNIPNYELVEDIAQVAGRLTLKINSLVQKSPSQGTKLQKSIAKKSEASGNDIKYLLESLVRVKMSNLYGNIIGYSNGIKAISMESLKYRNMLIPAIQFEAEDILLMSMVHVGKVQLQNTEKNSISILIDGLEVDIHTEMILYELKVGKGSKFIDSVISLTEVHSQIQPQHYTKPQLSLVINDLYFRCRLLEEHGLSLQVQQFAFQHNIVTFNHLIMHLLDEEVLQETNGKVVIKPHEVSIALTQLIVSYPLSKIFSLYTQITYLVENIRPFLAKELPPSPQLPLTRVKTDGVTLYLRSFTHEQLIKVSCPSIDLSTEEMRENKIRISIEHMNSKIKIYEPLLEPTAISLKFKSEQVYVAVESIKVILSYEMILTITQQYLQVHEEVREWNKNISDYLEEKNRKEFEKHKQLLHITQRPELKRTQLENKNQIVLRNDLCTDVLVEMKVEDDKHLLHLCTHAAKEVSFAIKSEYPESYLMVDKYKKLKIKISCLNQLYSTKTQSFVIALHDDVPTFNPVVFCDEFGREVLSGLGLEVFHKEDHYDINIVSLYRIESKIEPSIIIQWSEGLEIRREHLEDRKVINVPPWVVDRVGIGIEGVEGSLNSLQLWKHEEEWRKQSIPIEIDLDKEAIRKVMKILIVKEPLFLQRQPPPTTFRITYRTFIHNHFHNTVMINDENYPFDKCLPLKNVFKEGNGEFMRVKLGDGSMHELYLPSEHAEYEIRLREENYISIEIKCCPFEEEGQVVYHLYNRLELSLNFPKLVEPSIRTQIYDDWYLVKKEWLKLENMGEKYEDEEFKNKFLFNSHRYLLGNYERYIVLENQTLKSNKLVLYPSIYDDDVSFYDKETHEPMYIYSINYSSTFIDEQTQMFYVLILPKYYLANRTQYAFSVEGKAVLKQCDKVVLGNIKNVEIRYQTDHILLDCIHNQIDLNDKRQLLFYRSDGEENRLRDGKPVLFTANLKIIDILPESSHHNTITHVLQETEHWLYITNELDYTICVYSADEHYAFYAEIQSDSTGNYPYGINGVAKMEFVIKNSKEEIGLGEYQIASRLRDEIVIEGAEFEITMREARTDVGRKVTFSYSHNLPKNRELLLKISNSLSLSIGELLVSFVCWPENERREMLKVRLSDSELLMLRYPSGLYMLNISSSLSIHSAWVLQDILNIQELKVYVEGVENEFIERLSIEVEDRVKVYITDELILCMAEEVDKLYRESKQMAESLGIIYQGSKELHHRNYTSNINSLMVKPFEIIITTKKVIGSQKRRLLTSMGFSIIELEESCISLSKVEVDELITDSHLQEISRMYIKEIIVGCLGGMNMIGNPKQFSEEIQAARVKGWPVVGVVKGVVAGSANSISKIISTLSNGISELSFDEQYQKERNTAALVQPKGFFNGMKLGAFSLGHSLKSGVTGVVEKPYEGAVKDGGIGFLKGSLEGLTGLVVKPVTGIMDAVSFTIKGIKTVSSYRTEVEEYCLYLERPIYHKFRIIRPYRQEDQLAYNILLSLRKQRILSHEVELVEAFILEDDDGQKIEELVAITCSALYVISIQKQQITLNVQNDRMIATGKFLEGVVLYYDDGHGEQEEIVFRLQRDEKEKEKLYWSLKAFISLHSQSGENHNIAE